MGNGNNQHGVAGGKNILKVLYKYRDPVLTKTITFQRTFLDRGEAMQEGQRFEQVGSPDEVLNESVSLSLLLVMFANSILFSQCCA